MPAGLAHLRCDALVRLCTALAGQERIDEAEDAARRALGVDPGDPAALLVLGQVLARAGPLRRGARRPRRRPVRRHHATCCATSASRRSTCRCCAPGCSRGWPARRRRPASCSPSPTRTWRPSTGRCWPRSSATGRTSWPPSWPAPPSRRSPRSTAWRPRTLQPLHAALARLGVDAVAHSPAVVARRPLRPRARGPRPRGRRRGRGGPRGHRRRRRAGAVGARPPGRRRPRRAAPAACCSSAGPPTRSTPSTASTSASSPRPTCWWSPRWPAPPATSRPRRPCSTPRSSGAARRPTPALRAAEGLAAHAGARATRPGRPSAGVPLALHEVRGGPDTSLASQGREATDNKSPGRGPPPCLCASTPTSLP